MQTITPCLWFDGGAEEAAKFYTSIFRNSKIRKVARYGETGPGPKGSVMTVSFEIDGQEFLGLNGGPMFKFTPATSFIVNCTSQKEVDEYWTKLLEGGGVENQCGWLQDRFGLSWQIVPTRLQELISTPDPAKSQRVMAAMMTMVKLDVAELERAAAG